MSITITAERPDTPEAIGLIMELEAVLKPMYPPASQHGLSVEQLLAEAVPFFVVRADGAAAGCGGVQLVGTAYGEIKRMYMRPGFRGRGLAKLLLDHLADYACNYGVPLLRLETGVHQHEAIGLYERTGFYRIPPFAEYTDDPLSVYYEKLLNTR
jgi:ribosomal protein S18 acetylase RimI-like enzyme